jgi:hypothetical protein
MTRITAAAILALVPAAAMAQILPPQNHVLESTIHVDLTTHSARLPVYRGTQDGVTVWYILTDVSDRELAECLGLNFAPKLANASRGCPGCVQELTIPLDITQAGVVEFLGRPDFSMDRLVEPGPTLFPLRNVVPGAMAGPNYTPYVSPVGTTIVYNAPIVAVGEQPMDFVTHRDTHDRVLALDTVAGTVDILIVRAFSGGKEVVYLALDATSEESAALERSTFTPVLSNLAFPNGEFRRTSARAALFAFANGRTGASSPPAQGLNHLIADGHATEDAHLGNTALLSALRQGGDARNVIEVFPTMLQARLREEYSPAWDFHLVVWSNQRVAQGTNVAQTDSTVVRSLNLVGALGSPGGQALRSAGIEVNCPVVAFVNQPPLGLQRPILARPVPHFGGFDQPPLQ